MSGIDLEYLEPLLAFRWKASGESFAIRTVVVNHELLLHPSKPLSICSIKGLVLPCFNLSSAVVVTQEDDVDDEEPARQALAFKFLYEAVKGACFQSVFTRPPCVAQSSAFHKLE